MHSTTVMLPENVMQKSSASSSRRNEHERPDPRVLRCVRQIALAGLALAVVWPAARGYSQWIGWLPLWLIGMPMAAWWSLYRFRLPASFYRASRVRSTRRGAQARRVRGKPSVRARRSQAA